MTYNKQSEGNRLLLTLREFGIDEESAFGCSKDKFTNETFIQLVTYTPTNQSHLGDKFDSYKKLNNHNLDTFLKTIFSGLGVTNVYLFRTFTEKTIKKNDLRDTVIKDGESLLCLRCDNGVKNSLYMSIRNAIAHGNIICIDGYYVFYSVSDDKEEFDSNITFLLRIKKLRNLQTFFKVLETYRE